MVEYRSCTHALATALTLYRSGALTLLEAATLQRADADKICYGTSFSRNQVRDEDSAPIDQTAN